MAAWEGSKWLSGLGTSRSYSDTPLSLNTTQVYTSVAITDLKEAHAKCHPRERDDE